MAPWVEFRRSAFKHGVTRDQVLHVLTETAVYDEPIEGVAPVWLILGDDQFGAAPEVVMAQDPVTGLAVCIHAMPLRWRPEHHRYRLLYNDAKDGPR